MLHPARNLLLVEIPKPEAVTEGGIHIPEAARSRLPKGIVREQGPHYRKNTKFDVGTNHECSYPVGVTVYFSPYAGYDISVGDVDYLILQPEDIVATEGRL